MDFMTTDRQSEERKLLNERRTVSIIYTLMYAQSQQANWFQVATTRTLKGLGISSRELETLRNVGPAAHPNAVSSATKKLSSEHLETVHQFSKDATENEHMVTVFIDDFHNIHSHHRPSTSTQTQVCHMATLLFKNNFQQNVVLKFYPFFKDLFAFVFGSKRALAKKAKPWRISLLLVVLYGGWLLIRDAIFSVFAGSKDVQFLTLLNLLDIYIPLTLSIYSVKFNANKADLYYDSMLQCWIMFKTFRRKHYDKALLIALSSMEYWKSIEHPLAYVICQSSLMNIQLRTFILSYVPTPE